MLKVAAATAVFGIVHSAFASRAAKRVVTNLVGERHRNGLYRPFYITQSVVTFALLAEYIRRQPNRVVYQVDGAPAILMHSVQIAAMVYATAAARQVGIRRIVGIKSVAGLFNSQDEPIPSEPEAQGPALDAEGLGRLAGPFAWSRHPLNFAPIPILWLWPRMSTNLLAFNSIATVYLVIGSLHEEKRLKESYGRRYEAYLRSGVPFYLPRPNRRASCPLSKLFSNDGESNGPDLLAERARRATTNISD